MIKCSSDQSTGRNKTRILHTHIKALKEIFIEDTKECKNPILNI